MILERFRARLGSRARRKEQRAMVKRWYADGGDYRFRFDYPLQPDSVVFDLGGYEGQWASDLYSRQRCRVLIFEPVKRFADQIVERFRKNPDIAVYHYGLGATSRTETIGVCGASSSAYKRKTETELIRIIDAKDWFEQNAIGQVALMKINIEGGEFELLERLIGTGLIDNIENIQVQFHNFTPDASTRMASIQQDLAKTHSPTYQYRFVWENWQKRTSLGA
jgi:FkbM family methyltransferase